jgi:hypothetical protein
VLTLDYKLVILVDAAAEAVYKVPILDYNAVILEVEVEAPV